MRSGKRKPRKENTIIYIMCVFMYVYMYKNEVPKKKGSYLRTQRSRIQETNEKKERGTAVKTPTLIKKSEKNRERQRKCVLRGRPRKTSLNTENRTAMYECHTTLLLGTPV